VSNEKVLVKLDPERESLLTELQAEAIKRDTERREQEYDLHRRLMERQLKSMEGEAEYRAFIREQYARQADALERVVSLLERLKP
jgi:hypothetical protein